jgi:hypothetical protein
MFKPAVIAMDYETALLSGEPSLEYYRPDFRVTSAAFAWKGEDGTLKTRYVVGEAALKKTLDRIAKDGVPVVVHNLPFEYGCTLYRFPGLEGCIQFDTMRLTQVADNGGKEAQRYAREAVSYEDMLDAAESGEDLEYRTGLSLTACASRWLPAELQGHKDEAYAYLRSLGVKAGQEGVNLHRLPADVMERYNVADAIVTLALKDRLLGEFVAAGYEWELDHTLYRASAMRIAEAKGRGVKVDRTRLEAYRAKVAQEIADIEAAFRLKFVAELADIEGRMADAFVDALKTEKGRQGRRKQLVDDPNIARFNIGSGKQLRALFVDTLGIQPRFWTEESKTSRAKREKNPELKEFQPSPSFKSAHLPGYGEGGEILVERRKRLLVLQQADSLLGLSAHDGRWHVDLKACGTATGRFAGGRA